jgi:XTP/dITP diphosphohydrolase
VYSARFAAEDCPPDATREQIDAANNRRVLAELAGVGACMRTARFVSHAVLVAVDGDAAGTEEPRLNIIAETEGTCEGRITFEPAGTGGFGYDPLFFLPELGRTTAELPPEEKNAVSHRGRAMRRMAERLGELLDTGRN